MRTFSKQSNLNIITSPPPKKSFSSSCVQWKGAQLYDIGRGQELVGEFVGGVCGVMGVCVLGSGLTWDLS